MQRFPSMKIGLASFLSCLALVLGLYTTTGTASAHSAIHPFINVVSGLQNLGNCVSFQLEGGDFTPNHHVDLFADGGGSINPDRVRADGDGKFLVDVTACENQQFSNCGSFIESTNFCGFNLPQNDFCGLNGFSQFQTCPFIGSAMKPLPGPCMQPWCQQGQGGQGGQQCNGNMPPPWCQQGQGGQGGQQGQGGQGGQQGQGGQGGQQCNGNMPLPWCQHGQGGQGGQQGQGGQGQCNGNMPPPWCQHGQGGQGGQQHHLRFHIPVSNFCNFNRQQRFPFCFRFFHQQFPLQILITAVDEHTGHRAHVGISIG